MCPKEAHKYFSFCVGRGIRIYPVPVVANGSVLKICVENNGVEKIGEEKYTNEKVYEKINALYKAIFEKLAINKQSKNECKN